MSLLSKEQFHIMSYYSNAKKKTFSFGILCQNINMLVMTMWKALLVHGVRFIAKLLNFGLFIHS